MVSPVAKAKMRIFATSLEWRCISSSFKAGQSAGFTLIELLVVLAIAGLTLTIAPTVFEKAKETVQYRSTVRNVANELRKARLNALTYGTPAFFRMNLAERKFGSDDKKLRVLPDMVDVRVTVGEMLLEPGQVALIEFSPAGGATGGSIDVVRRSGGGTRVRVDWISSQIELEPLSQ